MTRAKVRTLQCRVAIAANLPSPEMPQLHAMAAQQPVIEDLDFLFHHWFAETRTRATAQLMCDIYGTQGPVMRFFVEPAAHVAGAVASP
jgi:hypothetical protein